VLSVPFGAGSEQADAARKAMANNGKGSSDFMFCMETPAGFFLRGGPFAKAKGFE
jgi:hypothetical protein